MTWYPDHRMWSRAEYRKRAWREAYMRGILDAPIPEARPPTPPEIIAACRPPANYRDLSMEEKNAFMAKAAAIYGAWAKDHPLPAPGPTPELRAHMREIELANGNRVWKPKDEI